MLDTFRSLKNPVERKILLSLWLKDHTVHSLSRKTRLDENALRAVLNKMQNNDLVVVDPRFRDQPVSLDEDFRNKVSLMMSRAIVSVTFLLVGFALTNFDRTFDKKQQKRIRYRLHDEGYPTQYLR